MASLNTYFHPKLYLQHEPTMIIYSLLCLCLEKCFVGMSIGHAGIHQRDVSFGVHWQRGQYCMTWSTEIIFYNTLPRECIGKYCPRDSISQELPYMASSRDALRNKSPWDFPRAGILHPLVLEIALGPWGMFFPIYPSSLRCMDTI